jgi:hypothetical protein
MGTEQPGLSKTRRSLQEMARPFQGLQRCIGSSGLLPTLSELCNGRFAVLRLLRGASREAVVRGVAPLGKDAPLPARRAWRFECPLGATALRLAEPTNISLTEH